MKGKTLFFKNFKCFCEKNVSPFLMYHPKAEKRHCKSQKIKFSYIVQLLVETASIADGFPALTPSPEGGGVRFTVAATRPLPPARGLKQKRLIY
jgi:hypothetical protein